MSVDDKLVDGVYRTFRCISRPYSLELKVKILLIFGIQPDLEILIILCK